MDISVVIPSYQTKKVIFTTLNALACQKTTITFEVIVVDCSESNEVYELCKNFGVVTCIYNKKRLDPGSGRNIGAKQASGKLLFFIDADVVLKSNALQEAWSFYNSNHYVYGGAIALTYDKEYFIPAHLEHYYFNHESQPERPTTTRNNLSSAILCVDSSLFIQNNGFKNIARMQDTEFTERLKSVGETLYFTPSIMGCQKQRSKLTTVLKKIFITGQNLYFIRYNTSNKKVTRLFFFFMLPFIGAAKITRITFRHFQYNSNLGRLKVLIFSPLLIVSGMVWTAGFYRAILFNNGINTNR